MGVGKKLAKTKEKTGKAKKEERDSGSKTVYPEGTAETTNERGGAQRNQKSPHNQVVTERRVARWNPRSFVNRGGGRILGTGGQKEAARQGIFALWEGKRTKKLKSVDSGRGERSGGKKGRERRRGGGHHGVDTAERTASGKTWKRKRGGGKKLKNTKGERREVREGQTNKKVSPPEDRRRRVEGGGREKRDNPELLKIRRNGARDSWGK